jgi:anti-sigma factor RsiW
VSDVASQLNEQDIAELGALADGTLPAERRAYVEARVAASPELRELVERQRQSLAATRSLANEPAPASLTATIEARRLELGSRRVRNRRLALRLGAVGALAAVVVAVVVLSMSGGPGTPSVADAARLALQPPTGPAPAPLGTNGTQLAIDVQGVVFPDLAASYGWHALGVRHGRVGGRDATAVYYGKGGRRIVYAIVAGPGLPPPSDAQATTLGGVQYQTLRLNGSLAVTWRRAGHTCVLIGAAPRAELLALASWPGGGTLR